VCSVLYPAWFWTHTPNEPFLFASYARELSIRDAVKARRLIESVWYRTMWPHVELLPDNNLKASYQNTEMGIRQTTSVGGTVTGLGGKHLILDDPHNVKEAESPLIRDAAVEWFRESWSTRANSHDTVRIVIQQRVHEKDVAGYCIESKDFDHLNLPMQYEGKKSAPTSLGWVDPREEHGATLWPARYSVKAAEALKKTLGEYAYASQFQQTPVPRGGGLFKREWLRFWYNPELGEPKPIQAQNQDGKYFDLIQKPLPHNLDLTQGVQSWDLSFKGLAHSDYVVGQVWVPDKGNRYLLDQERGRWDYPATKAAFKRLTDRCPIGRKLVEERANGSAVMSELKESIPGMIAITPQGGKESRASAITAFFEAGNVWLPHPAQFPWVTAFIDELVSFPRAANDDQVDAMSQGLAYLASKSTALVEFEASSDEHDLNFLVKDDPAEAF
jgi:predicted phage terminase large subunit-like protein